MATARDSEDVVNCICGVDHDDGKWMICCDVCNTWLHTNCLRLTKRKIKALVTCAPAVLLLLVPALNRE